MAPPADSATKDAPAAGGAFEERSPFERLAALLAGIESGEAPIDLTVGGPRHAMPDFVGQAIAGALPGFRAYPAISGTDAFQGAVHDWLDRRYGLGGRFRDAGGTVLPLSGSREGLFFAGIAARDHLNKPGRPAVLFANPFYQAYPAAAHALGAEAVPVAVARPDTVLPDLTGLAPDVLDRAVALYVASPSNPQGTVASGADWQHLFDLAHQHDLMLFADECYSEIFRERAGPPTGALQALRGPDDLARLVVFNSLSKRSNLAGLRCGFAAGGAAFMDRFRRFRNQAAPQVPAPIQAVAARAFADEAHVVENRRLYDEKFAAAEEILGDLFPGLVPDGGFFLWLDLTRHGARDDVAFARDLWAATGVKAVPGSYLALTGPHDNNPGGGFLRLALVDDLAAVRSALRRLRSFLGVRASQSV